MQICLPRSYHPVKAITTGEGGSILCNNGINKDNELKKLRNHSMREIKVMILGFIK